jgi:signal transduction histidine kinase
MENSKEVTIIIVAGTVVLIILILFIIIFLMMYKNRQMRHQLEMEAVQEKFNQEILKTQLEIQEQTLKKLSEEIHDNVGQVLSLAVMNLSAIDVSDSVKATAKIENTTSLVQKAVGDLRNLSKTMDPDNITAAGLSAMIKFELDLVEKTGLYKTSFICSGTERSLGCQRDIILYRMLQETINNIIKHAKANFIIIALNFKSSEIQLEIADNGIGFNTDLSEKIELAKSGAGLKNIKRRTEILGGTVQVKSVPGSGTNLFFTIPLSLS